jgi:thiosulfate dehydrogenase
MIKGFIMGFFVGLAAIAAAVYFYFSTGKAPVATSDPAIPFERKLAHIGLHAYLDRKPHLAPQVPVNEQTYLAGVQIYREHCAVCHGLPGEERTAIAAGMAPEPPQLFKGVGVTDDEAWETYWKIEGGIRMTGMPGFRGRLSDAQIWQVTMLVKNADQLPAPVRVALAGPPALATSAAVAAPSPSASSKPQPPKLQQPKSTKH